MDTSFKLAPAKGFKAPSFLKPWSFGGHFPPLVQAFSSYLLVLSFKALKGTSYKLAPTKSLFYIF